MNDERSLLGGKPEFNNPKKYLESGKMTNHLESNIQEIAQKISGETTEEIVRKIVIYMNKNVTMNRLDNDEKKFKRTAEEIVEDGYRNGCSDSSILFIAIARAKGIPTMQIVSFNKNLALELEGTDRKITEGHFWAGVFSKEDKKWYLVDSDANEEKLRNKDFYRKLDLENRNLTKKYHYAFAYVNDFREIELNDMRIDSIENIGKIQRDVYKLCDKKYISFEKDYEYDDR